MAANKCPKGHSLPEEERAKAKELYESLADNTQATILLRCPQCARDYTFVIDRFKP
jgi:hypothetical protein